MKNPIAYDVFASLCPSRAFFDKVLSRWGILILIRLKPDTLHFGDLRRAIGGISEKMLSQTLKILTEEGLVKRNEVKIKSNLVNVEYSLTESGKRLSESLNLVISELYKGLETRCNKKNKNV